MSLLPTFLLIIFSSMLSLHSDASFATQKIEAAKEDLSDIKQQLKDIKKQLGDSQKAHHDVTDALKDSETAISAADQKLRQIQQQQKQNESALATLQAQTTATNIRLAAQQQQLSELLYQQYVHHNQNYAELILQNKHPNEIARDLKYQSYIAKAHAQLIADMEANLAHINDLNTQKKAALQQTLDLKNKQMAEKQTLQAQKQEKAQVLKKLSQQIAAQRNQIKKLNRDERQLSDLVKKLARIVPKPLPKKSPATVNTQKKNPSSSIVNNQITPDNSYADIPFKSLKGKLRLPVRGQLTNRFGQKRENSITWKGLFIRANAGTEVKSVASGRVVFADWMRGFGNLIIIDHGDGYMSLYANNEATLKSVGQTVAAGDTIATVGNTGGNESDGLYYELRQQSLPFDPLSWSNTH